MSDDMTGTSSSSLPTGGRLVYEAKEDLNGFILIPPEVLSDPQIHAATPEGMSLEWIDEQWLGHRALVIHNFFSPSECQSIIDFCEGRTANESAGADGAETSHGIMIPAHSRTDYRNNLRVIAKSTELASILFSRLLPFLGKLNQEGPSTKGDDGSTSRGNELVITSANAQSYEDGGIGVVGTWTPSHLNPAFRICKYFPDGHFGPHYDGEFFESYTSRSFKTFMIYLNDDYDNGCTNFLQEHSIHYDPSTKRYQAPEGCVRAKLKAKQGDLLLFDHLLLHEVKPSHGASSISCAPNVCTPDAQQKRRRRNDWSGVTRCSGKPKTWNPRKCMMQLCPSTAQPTK